MDYELQGKAVLVTGAASGIGRTTARLGEAVGKLCGGGGRRVRAPDTPIR